MFIFQFSSTDCSFPINEIHLRTSPQEKTFMNMRYKSWFERDNMIVLETIPDIGNLFI